MRADRSRRDLMKIQYLSLASLYDEARAGAIMSRSRRYIGAIGDLLIGFKCYKAVTLQRVPGDDGDARLDRRTVISAFAARR